MKRNRIITKYILPAALAMIALGGCGNSDDEPAAGRDYPEFSATFGQVESRVTGTSWDDGDKIGIYGDGAINISHTHQGNGSFKVTNNDEQIKFKDDNEVVFTSYYPWTDKLTDGVISVSTEDQTNQSEFDFLWATANGKRSDPKVAFEFAHKMTKLLITVKCGTGVTYDALTLSLSGLKHGGSFSIADGTTSAKGDPCGTWPFSNNPQTDDEKKELSFQLIFFPQTFENPLELSAQFAGKTLTAKIDFTAANGKKDGEPAENELVGGRQYNLNVTLSNSDVVFSECTIAPWNLIDDHDEVDAR